MSTGTNLNLTYQKKSAKRLLRQLRDAEQEAIEELSRHHPRFIGGSSSQAIGQAFSLHDAQLVIARKCGFPSWPAMVAFIGEDEANDTGPLQLTAKQVDLFLDQGYLRIPNAFGPQQGRKMEQFIWGLLAQLHGFVRMMRLRGKSRGRGLG